MRIEYEAFRAGCSGRRNRGRGGFGERGKQRKREREKGGGGGGDAPGRERKRRGGKKDGRHARGSAAEDEERRKRRCRGGAEKEGENGFTRQSLSGRPRENHNARPPSPRPSPSPPPAPLPLPRPFCPPVRSSVCLPVHPFVSSSASCHSPRQPSDGSRIRNSSPLLSSSGFSFCSFPAAATAATAAAAGLLLCTVLLPGRSLKFDPVTRGAAAASSIIAADRSAPPLGYFGR